MSENRFHTGAHAGANTLLDVFCPLYKTDPTHYMVSVFDTEDLADFLRDCDSTSGYDLSEERNVFFVDLYGQIDRSAIGVGGQ